MNAYTAEVVVTTTWEIEVHAEDEAAAEEAIKGMGACDIEDAANFKETVEIEVMDIEMDYVHGEDWDE